MKQYLINQSGYRDYVQWKPLSTISTEKNGDHTEIIPNQKITLFFYLSPTFLIPFATKGSNNFKQVIRNKSSGTEKVEPYTSHDYLYPQGNTVHLNHKLARLP